MTLLSPSLLAADFTNLREEISKIEQGGADYLHLDVMDGNYVPNISFGPSVIKSLRPISNLVFDVHLMIDKPERYIEDFVDAGADIITVHPESTTHLHRVIQMIKDSGVKAGVTLNPGTSLEAIEYVLEDVDMVLIMSVNPGFGGQKFIETMKGKIRKLRELIDSRGLDIKIEVDGGVKLDNAREIIDCGVDILVAGSAIFGADDIVEMTKKFKNI